MESNALISSCGQYRHWLKRPREINNPGKGTALFVMLNPSTADHSEDDPTIRRCRGFARDWDCNGLTVANLYALRSTDPKNLWAHEDPVGEMNDYWLKSIAKEHGDIVCAWGSNAKSDRVRQFVESMKSIDVRMWCLGVTKSGMPLHPLYIKRDTPLIPWSYDA